MRQVLLCILILFTGLSGNSQETKPLFSEAIAQNLPAYNAEADQLLRQGDMEGVKALFQSFVDQQLEGSVMDDFKVEGLSQDIHSLGEFSKPVFLLTYSAWCIPSKGEIPALNRLAEEYGDDIDFVVLYWDNRKMVKKEAKQFSEKINIIYVDEQKNNGFATIKNLKHALGLPLNFVMNSDKEILHIGRRLTNSMGITLESAFEKNYTLLADNLSSLKMRISDEIIQEGVASF
ncbi:TlpA family protein disulfide reductase [Croceiramulus getboli]|nr:redoxin domain-containing protein [Flavobacteriaceae bacterium YJPT1-3]